MKSRHLVNPELVPFLPLLRNFDFSPETLPEIRRVVLEDLPVPAPETMVVTVREAYAPGRDGAPPVRLVIYRPESKEVLPIYFHIHGGGFVLGTPEMAEARNRFIAHDIGCVVVSVDYRLCPETPFPGPLEDCYAGLAWTYANANQLGGDHDRIAIGGQSAGGGLTAALALLARDRAEVPLIFQMLIFPMLDDRTGSANEPHPNPYAGEYCWTPKNNRYGWTSMLGREPGGDNTSPYAAPARATDLVGLPPAFISIGALDLFIDEDIDYARRLIRAGVPTELHVYPGGFHGMDMFPGTEARAVFTRDYHEALRSALRSSKASKSGAT